MCIYIYIYQYDVSDDLRVHFGNLRRVTQALQQLAAPLCLAAQLFQLRRLTPGALPEATHLLHHQRHRG